MDNTLFKECGSNVQIYEPTVLINPHKFKIKDNVIISEFCHIYGGTGIEIGNYVHISANVCVGGGGKLVVGNFVNISAGSHIVTGTDSANGDALVGAAIPMKFRNVDRSFVILSDYSWVATNVTVMPGITIGEGSVVGAGSVVLKDVEPWTIVAGNPAKVIRLRQRDKIIDMAKELYNRRQNDTSTRATNH